MIDEGKRHKILIADDSFMNRSILTEMLGNEFDIIEAEDGVQAVQILKKEQESIDVVLLDIVMPNMDGFEVLAVMNKNHWIENTPVIMISSENAHSTIERAYELGVTDFINRPFDASVVYRRVINTIMLYAKQKKLVQMIADQIYAKEKSSSLMITILSHIVEFRNGESGLHVLHINVLTKILLKTLMQKTTQYNLTQSDVSLISMASALHDIGKIAIPDEILNKPGRLTKEEFEIMKTHSSIGAEMLKDLSVDQDDDLIKVAYQICRWHHERYDGRGYPDGLKGEEIPISAQIVSLADVYDALTSERVYKRAYTHVEAMRMILNGECGTFNPLLLECLKESQDVIQSELAVKSKTRNMEDIQNVVAELSKHQELSSSSKIFDMLQQERNKTQFFYSLSTEILFDYQVVTDTLNLSDYGAKMLGLDVMVNEPYENSRVLKLMHQDDLEMLSSKLRSTKPEDSIVQFDFEMNLDGKVKHCRMIVQAVWSQEAKAKYLGAIGKVLENDEDASLILKNFNSYDVLTGLLNVISAKDRIKEKLLDNQKYSMILIDICEFHKINENYGHIVGDRVLTEISQALLQGLSAQDVIARVGGNKFMVFTDSDVRVVTETINSTIGQADSEITITARIVSASTEETERSYEKLFELAIRRLKQQK